jgi:hypothetical protein
MKHLISSQRSQIQSLSSFQYLNSSFLAIRLRSYCLLTFVIMMFQHVFYVGAGLNVASCHTTFVQLAAEKKTNGNLTIFSHYKTQETQLASDNLQDPYFYLLDRGYEVEDKHLIHIAKPSLELARILFFTGLLCDGRLGISQCINHLIRNCNNKTSRYNSHPQKPLMQGDGQVRGRTNPEARHCISGP